MLVSLRQKRSLVKSLVYTTETDLLEQEAERSAQIDAEWQRRLWFLRSDRHDLATQSP